MNSKLIISEIAVSNSNGQNELRAIVDGDPIFLRVPENHILLPSAEFFIGIALLEAMFTGRDIVVEGTSLSDQLFKSLSKIQGIYSCWNNDLKMIRLETDTCSENLNHINVGSFFSAGVDSTYTLLRNMDEISHLIMFNVFDYGNDQASWEKRVNRQKIFSESVGKVLITAETNAREWAEHRKISWRFGHGLFLSSVASVFGMRKVYVPSSHTYNELFPWGSHPLSDPLWSTESTEVIHDGAGSRRSDKMKDILENELLSDNLQTCWENTHKNCGECPKCARSILAAYLLGKKTGSLPPYQGIKTLKALKAGGNENAATFLEDAIILSKNSNNRRIYKTLKKYYRHYQSILILHSIDRCFLGNSIRYIYRKVKKPSWLDWRVTLRGMNRWDI